MLSSHHFIRTSTDTSFSPSGTSAATRTAKTTGETTAHTTRAHPSPLRLSQSTSPRATVVHPSTPPPCRRTSRRRRPMTRPSTSLHPMTRPSTRRHFQSTSRPRPPISHPLPAFLSTGHIPTMTVVATTPQCLALTHLLPRHMVHRAGSLKVRKEGSQRVRRVASQTALTAASLLVLTVASLPRPLHHPSATSSSLSASTAMSTQRNAT